MGQNPMKIQRFKSKNEMFHGLEFDIKKPFLRSRCLILLFVVFLPQIYAYI